MPFLIAIGLLLSIVGTPSTETTAECTLEPLTLPLFDGTPVAEWSNGEPADVPTPDTEAVEAILLTYVACANADDPRLVWSVFSPEWFRDQFSDSTIHYLPAFEQRLELESSNTREPLVLEEVIAVESLLDGRLSVRARFSSDGKTWTDTLILVNVDGQWLIDDVVSNPWDN